MRPLYVYSTHIAMLLAKHMVFLCYCIEEHYNLVYMLSICQGYTAGTCTTHTSMVPQKKYKHTCEPT